MASSLKSQASTVQAPVLVKVRRDVVKVRRAGSQCGAGNPKDERQKVWFTELAQSRGSIVKDCGEYLTYHTPTEISIPQVDIQPGEVFIGKDGKSISQTPVVENVLIEIDQASVLPTDTVVK
jgi:hypothetical protein